ncbi:MAG: LPXTG cell wall anchor domain-containing protein [Clostridia bacterium]|nr:LPXTG cell wall anchor domain-containing protein [Clostridia bacterium]
MIKRGLCLGATIFILSFLIVLLPINFQKANASDLEIIGSQDGIAVKPQGEKFFDLNNLNPGDTKTAMLSIKSVYRDPFDLYMRAERVGEEQEYDLFNQLKLKVNYDGTLIFDGSMTDFARSNISLGRINKNDHKHLLAEVYLPGRETGNEFQGKTVDVRWIFTAQSLTSPDEIVDIEDEEVPIGGIKFPESQEGADKKGIPKTGDKTSILIYAMGFILALIGTKMAVKSKN